MPTATEVDVSDLTEFEFAKPCESEEHCDQEAVALYCRSHTLDGCWGEPVHMCQLHLVRSLRRYEDWLSKCGVCRVCASPVVGGLATNVRIVRI